MLKKNIVEKLAMFKKYVRDSFKQFACPVQTFFVRVDIKVSYCKYVNGGEAFQ